MPTNEGKFRRAVIGIDEVGRGALAGPVVLAAVLVRGRVSWTHPFLGRIRESKQLTPKRRQAWFAYLARQPALAWRIARTTPRVIDRINIAAAANRAAFRAYRRVTNGTAALALLDGSLALPATIPHRTIIGGDERYPIIAAASIIAKVMRDRYMVKLASRWPHYGFAAHKGYGTRLHQRMLVRHGPAAVHRMTFLP